MTFLGQLDSRNSKLYIKDMAQFFSPNYHPLLFSPGLYYPGKYSFNHSHLFAILPGLKSYMGGHGHLDIHSLTRDSMSYQLGLCGSRQIAQVWEYFLTQLVPRAGKTVDLHSWRLEIERQLRKKIERELQESMYHIQSGFADTMMHFLCLSDIAKLFDSEILAAALYRFYRSWASRIVAHESAYHLLLWAFALSILPLPGNQIQNCLESFRKQPALDKLRYSAGAEVLPLSQLRHYLLHNMTSLHGGLHLNSSLPNYFSSSAFASSPFANLYGPTPSQFYSSHLPQNGFINGGLGSGHPYGIDISINGTEAGIGSRTEIEKTRQATKRIETKLNSFNKEMRDRFNDQEDIMMQILSSNDEPSPMVFASPPTAQHIHPHAFGMHPGNWFHLETNGDIWDMF